MAILVSMRLAQLNVGHNYVGAQRVVVNFRKMSSISQPSGRLPDWTALEATAEQELRLQEDEDDIIQAIIYAAGGCFFDFDTQRHFGW